MIKMMMIMNVFIIIIIIIISIIIIFIRPFEIPSSMLLEQFNLSLSNYNHNPIKTTPWFEGYQLEKCVEVEENLYIKFHNSIEYDSL